MSKFDFQKLLQRPAPRPGLLLHPNIPKPMHGMAPRVVLGEEWWDTTRRAAYHATRNHCAACDVHGLSQMGDYQVLEAHETYKIEYRKGTMTYLETVALCHYCHAHIHRGRLLMLLQTNKISQKEYGAILDYGDRILKRNQLKGNKPYTGPCARWERWRLVIDGVEYPGKYKSEDEWRQAYASPTGQIEE